MTTITTQHSFSSGTAIISLDGDKYIKKCWAPAKWQGCNYDDEDVEVTSNDVVLHYWENGCGYKTHFAAKIVHGSLATADLDYWLEYAGRSGSLAELEAKIAESISFDAAAAKADREREEERQNDAFNFAVACDKISKLKRAYNGTRFYGYVRRNGGDVEVAKKMAELGTL